MDENIQDINEDLTNQSNEDEDNENSDEAIQQTIQQYKRIKGQTSSERIVRTPHRYMHFHTKFSKNTQEYEPKYAQLMALIMEDLENKFNERKGEINCTHKHTILKRGLRNLVREEKKL